MSPRVLLVNPNSNERTTSLMVQMATVELEKLSPVPVEIIGSTITQNPPMLVEPEALDQSVPITVAHTLGRVGADESIAAVVIAAFGDPGVADLRQILEIPVSGIGEAALTQASKSGAFSIATTTPLLEGSIRAQVDGLGLSSYLRSIRIPLGDPVELAANESAQTLALQHAIDQSVQDGAKAVVIGAGPLARSADTLQAKNPIPIVNPIRAVCQVVEISGQLLTGR